MSVSNAYVVGYGMIDALGSNPSQCFKGMLDDKNYSTKLDCMGDHKIQYGIPCHHDTLLPEGFAPKKLKTMTRAQELAIHAVDQALKHSNLPHSSNVAVIISSCSNDVESLDANFQRLKDNKRVNPFTVVNRIPDMIVGHICTQYQFHGASLALQASCATGMYSIDYAMRILDEYDYVIVGGSDAGVFEMALKYFSSIGALGNRNMPFDEEREGFVMGEGAGVMILQSMEKVQEYGSKIHAKLFPVGAATDGFDLTSPASDGRGAKIAMNKAVSKLPTKKIDMVSAHATSTPVGDIIEYQTIIDKFGDIPIYAPKSKIGHTLGASGILECIYSIESMKRRIIPRCFNLHKASYDLTNSLVRASVPLSGKIDTLRTMNNSFGFGGKCASQVIEVSWFYP